MRTYRCSDCPPGAGEHEAGGRGPLPDCCPTHKAERARRRMRLRRSGLTVVPVEALAEVLVAVAPAPPAELEVPPPSMGDVVRAELEGLMTTHPARDALTAMAVHLAGLASHPLAVTDLRALVALHREIRETIRDLVKHEEAADDDLFGDDDLPTAMVDTAAG